MTAGGKRIQVVLADDHPIVLAGIKSLLQSAPEIELLGEATDGLTALSLLKQLTPDIAIIDVSMPGLTGVELANRLSAECPNVRVIALTVHEDQAYVQPLLQAGARGYMLKRSAADDLVRAVRAVADGGLYLDPAIAEKAMPAPAEDGLEGEVVLSPRELKVMQYTAQGLSNKEIAAKLDLSVKTIETYKARACEKLGLRSRSAIVRFGSSRGWLDDIV